MFSLKAFLGVGAVLLISFAVSASAECKGCLGRDLINISNVFEQKQQCWFNPKHHYLLNFKLELLSATVEQLVILIQNSNARAPEHCPELFPVIDCLEKDSDAQASCHVDNVQSLVNAYNVLEQCANEVLDNKQLDLVFKLLHGQMMGWKQIHDTC